MDERVTRLETPEECEQFALNVDKTFPDLAQHARRRAVELKAAQYGAKNDAEREAVRAVYAYERALRQKHGGKNIRASRTWQMIRNHGIIPAVEKAVNRNEATVGYEALLEMGMGDFAFEVVVCRYPELFSAEAVDRSRRRLAKWEHDIDGS